jgi:DNA mismatch repair protein MutS2
MLARDHVVANDIEMDEQVRVLVISGPNTGGKTVTLKIVGLFALMVRGGLHPPCGALSEMAVFSEIYADIGDAQDLTKDLSSFSAHMTQMIRLLEEAGGAKSETGETGETGGKSEKSGKGGTGEKGETSEKGGKGGTGEKGGKGGTGEKSETSGEEREGPVKALVLLDEPVTSTDPNEGAALAEALLIKLAGLGMKVIATTHYNSLKALAQTTAGFMNASVEFDVTRLAPTYRVIMGIPGGSSAIDIAGRLGMDETILDHALGLLRREDRTLDQLLGELQDKHRRLDEDLSRAAESRAAAERSEREAAEAAERVQLTEREQRKGLKKKLTDELLRARAQVQEVLDGLKGERTLVKAREAKQRLAEIDEQIRAQLVPEEEKIPLDQLAVGDRVEIVSLGAIGTLLEAPLGKKRVRVRIGEAEMSVAAALLTGRTGKPEEESRHVRQDGTFTGRRKASTDSLAGVESSSVLDLRGTTADDALDMTVAALDRAALSGAPTLRIIHGHGTGRLKTVLRDYLRDSPYVAAFRPGDRAEGGDGVTIAELR